MTVRIDSHQHFWELSRPFHYEWLRSEGMEPICRDFLPWDLKPHLDEAGIQQSIFVQTQHDLRENDWALGLAEQHDWIAGVVGWVDLASEACEAQVAACQEHVKFVGVRHITQDEPDDDFIVGDNVLRGLRVLERREVPFDLLFYVRHLRHAATLGRQLPQLPMVVDHLAKPRIKDGAVDDWLPHLKAAAECDNIYCKLSGMVTEADWHSWSAADLRPYVESALEAFGVERCMFGSDWPVCELAASYEQVHGALVEILGELSERERGLIFGEVAQRFYRLDEQPDDNNNSV